MSVKTGDMAPDFTLVKTDGKKVSLKDYSDKNAVLLFFPFAYSSVCTEEMCSMQNNLKTYEQLDANIFGISIDSHYTLRKWAKELNLNFHLLSDFNKEASEKYGVLDTINSPGKYDYKGVARRSAFVIGKDGKIKYAEVCAHNGLQPDYEAIKNVLDK